jgi:hypothetical protein
MIAINGNLWYTLNWAIINTGANLSKAAVHKAGGDD